MEITATPMVMEKEINCHNFQGLFRYLGKHYGDQGIQTVIDGLIGTDRFLLTDTNHPAHVRPVEEKDLTNSSIWVSNELSLSLLANVRKVVAGSNPLFIAGEGATLEIFSQNVFFLARILGPKRVAKRVTKINALFNKTKTVTLDELTDHSATFKLVYVPGVRVTKDVCQWNMGIYSGISKLSGVMDVRVEEKTCRVEGDPCCTIEVNWKNVRLWKQNLPKKLKKGVVLFCWWMMKP